jgi:hypothetical protein
LALSIGISGFRVRVDMDVDRQPQSSKHQNECPDEEALFEPQAALRHDEHDSFLNSPYVRPSVHAFILVTPKPLAKKIASDAMGAAVRALLPADQRASGVRSFGVRPLDFAGMICGVQTNGRRWFHRTISCGSLRGRTAGAVRGISAASGRPGIVVDLQHREDFIGGSSARLTTPTMTA